MRKLIFLSGIFSVLLASCGGSSNCEGSALLLGAIPSASCQNSKDGGSEIKTGKFLDSAVNGLTYQTPTQSGTTNANGEFTYKAGEVVQFKLFGITIGSATGDEVMTPTSIAPSTGSGDFPLNVLRLLQTVDTDSDPTNGITLPSTLAYANLSFDKSKNDFETASTSAGLSLVSEDNALNHFRQTLNSQFASDSYTFNLAGKTASAYYVKCTNEVVAFTIKFETDSVTILSGTDSVNINIDGSCTAKSGGVDGPYTYSDMLRDGSLVPCGSSICTLNQLNNVYQGTDFDNRTWKQVVSHVKNTKTIKSTKSWGTGQNRRVSAIILKFN